MFTYLLVIGTTVGEMWVLAYRTGHVIYIKLQAVVYDIPPTTAVLDYAIGLEKLSANGLFFVGAQMAGTL